MKKFIIAAVVVVSSAALTAFTQVKSNPATKAVKITATVSAPIFKKDIQSAD